MKKNAEIAKVLRQIGFLLEMESKETNLKFKVRAYQQASNSIANMPFNLEELYANKGLDGLLKLPMIGKAIAAKIEEYLTTGRSPYLEELKSRFPINIEEFYQLEGLGPKTVKILYDRLNIKSIKDLEREISKGRLLNIAGFTKNKQELIQKKILLLKKGKTRYLIGDIYPMVKQMESELLGIRGVREAVAAGSFRRMKETVGDIDFVVASDEPNVVIEHFVNMPQVYEVLRKGSSKAFVQLNNGMDADLLVVRQESFGAALQYFTGSKAHAVAIRSTTSVAARCDAPRPPTSREPTRPRRPSAASASSAARGNEPV